jgi:hypothetical protein
VCGPVAWLAPPAPRGPRSRRVVLSLPSSLGDLIRQSEDLRLTSQHGWLEKRSWAFEGPPAWSPHLPDFHCCTLQDCRLQLPPGVWYVHPHSSVPALAIGEREETLGISNAPAISSARGPNVDGSCVRSRYGPPGCSPPGLIRPSRGSACLRLLHPGFQSSRHPEDCRISLRRHMGNCADRTCTCKYNS